MPENSLSVLCGKCQLPLDEDRQTQPEERTPCPSCGSTTRIFNVTVNDNIVIHDKIGLKARHSGAKKPFAESISGADLYRKTNKWMNLTRVFDRDNDQYKEIISDPITGEVVKECIEPLSKHIGHGSVKHKKSGSDSI